MPLPEAKCLKEEEEEEEEDASDANVEAKEIAELETDVE